VQYWLWNYGPSVIRQQLALKRELTRLGYYPSPLDDYFVREATEQALLLTADGAPLSMVQFRLRESGAIQLIGWLRHI
jgi:hypothetical protein